MSASAETHMMSSKELYLRLLQYVLPYRTYFALALFGTVLVGLTEPLLPALLDPLINKLFVEKDADFIMVGPALIIGVVLLKGVFGYVSSMGMRWISIQVVTDLRQLMFARIVDLPTAYFDRNPSGQTISKLTYDVTRVMAASTEVLVILVRDGLAVIGLLGWMFYLNWQLALINLAVAPPAALTIYLISRRLRSVSRAIQQRMGLLTNVIQEGARGQRVIKIFDGKDYESQRFAEANDQVRRGNVKLFAFAEANSPVVHLLTAFALAVIVFFAGRMAQVDAIDVGQFVSMFTAMAMLFAPLKRLSKMNEHLQTGLAAAESIFALVDEPKEPNAGTQQLTSVTGRLSFDDVRFQYQTDAGAEVVLKGISLHIAAGERVAFVGPSGSGKTSLVNLVPRFYNLTGGTIRLDDTDITQLDLVALRRHIAYVSQDIVLFNDTIANNIAYAQGSAVDQERVRRAADAAYATGFIEQLPQGFDTFVGEDGVRLSGGQRQRIAIARALYKDAPVLILDEATSALDSESEREIQLALENLEQGRTVLMIAHRLSTIENASCIYVLEAGVITEQGTHDELMQHNGLYANLRRLQESGVEI